MACVRASARLARCACGDSENAMLLTCIDELILPRELRCRPRSRAIRARPPCGRATRRFARHGPSTDTGERAAAAHAFHAFASRNAASARWFKVVASDDASRFLLVEEGDIDGVLRHLGAGSARERQHARRLRLRDDGLGDGRCRIVSAAPEMAAAASAKAVFFLIIVELRKHEFARFATPLSWPSHSEVPFLHAACGRLDEMLGDEAPLRLGNGRDRQAIALREHLHVREFLVFAQRGERHERRLLHEAHIDEQPPRRFLRRLRSCSRSSDRTGWDRGRPSTRLSAIPAMPGCGQLE